MIIVGNIYAGLSPGGGGTLTGADNGLSLDGTGKIVELGGVLIHATTVDCDGQDVQFIDTTGKVFQFLLSQTSNLMGFIGDDGAGGGSRSLIIGGNEYLAWGQDSAGYQARLDLKGKSVCQFIVSVPIGARPLVTVGIDLGDGFYNAIKATTVSWVAISSTNTSAFTALYRVNMYMYPTTLGIGSNITGSFHYTDAHGVNQTFNFPVVNSTNPTAFSPVIFAVQAGGLVDIEVTVTGTATYDAFVSVERIANVS